MADLANLTVSPKATMREVMECIDRSGKGIVLVLDGSNRLIGTVTDGDLRRAVLAGVNVDHPVDEVLAYRRTLLGTAQTAPVGTPDDALLHMMNETGMRQIPLIDSESRVVDVAFLNELVKEYEFPLRAVVMAGGFGTRLRPLTDDLPKPMLPVGSKPLLELILNQLRDAGIKHVNVATHYRADLIADHFKDGQDFGLDIRYVREDQPLGTAGALGLLEESDDPLVVINGDILTRVDFRAMHSFHREHGADLTIGVRQYEFRVPYGVVNTDGVVVTGISEKPVLRQFINAGIYLLDPSVSRLVPNRQRYDLPELIERLLAGNRRVVSFPIREYWLDIGRADHYDQAQADVAAGRF
jgi:Nucleoside-diphosphate-sugar pyrophosphorylase involved in lipopolysaccharide biosynthesis/translation initiation factor 2B, gamma/epsilon subunits (eIF-2Bgamma/eIF-2Bepsilon)